MDNSDNNQWYYNGAYYPPPPASEQPPPDYEWSQWVHQACQNFSVPPPNYTPYPTAQSQTNYDYSYAANYDTTYPSYSNVPPVPPTYTDYANSAPAPYDYSKELESYKLQQNRDKPSGSESQKTYTESYTGKEGSKEPKDTTKDSRSRSPYSTAYKGTKYKSLPSRSGNSASTSTDRSRPSTSTSAKAKEIKSSLLRNFKNNSSERKILLSKWRKNYCTTREEISKKIEEMNSDDDEDILAREKKIWTRTTPADLYYQRDENNPRITKGTPRLLKVCQQFKNQLISRAERINAMKPVYEPPPRKNRARICKHKSMYKFI